jgi:hypothetical protein
MRYLFYFSLLAFYVHLAGEEFVSMRMEVLDSGVSSFNNPLGGIKAFRMFLHDESNDPVTKFCIQELKKIGVVKTFSMAKAPIDYEGMGTGMCLELRISELDVLDNPDSAITRITLYLESSVEIVQTKLPYNARIWETNVFVRRDSIMDGIEKILKPFIHYYKEANPNEKPVFYVYLYKDVNWDVVISKKSGIWQGAASERKDTKSQ